MFIQNLLPLHYHHENTMKSIDAFGSLMELIEHFNTEEVCRKYMAYERWQGKATCPDCGCEKVYHYEDGIRYKCSSCIKIFNVKSGTIYEGSRVPLRKWFVAIYMLIEHKKGISSYQLARDIKVTQKTAWFMLHRLRHKLGMDNDQNEELDGVVSADETFVGGKQKNKHKHKKDSYERVNRGREHTNKTPIVGFLQWGGKVRTVVVPDVTVESLIPVVRRNITEGAILVTDEWRSYRRINTEYHHEVVQHQYGRFMNDSGFTTNNLEGFWTWIKRMIMGVYHKVSRKHLQLYAHEATFRYNTRNMTLCERLNYALSLNNGKLGYKQLIS